MKKKTSISQVQESLLAYYKNKEEEEHLNNVYIYLKKIFTAIVYSYYLTTIEIIGDIETIAHSAAIDLVESILLHNKPETINSFYLREKIRPYLPCYKYSLTKDETRNRNNIVDIEDLITDNGDNEEHSFELTHKYYKHLSTDGGLGSLEKDIELNNVLSLIYDKVCLDCPIEFISGMLANLAITTRFIDINLAQLNSVEYGILTESLKIKAYRAISNDGFRD